MTTNRPETASVSSNDGWSVVGVSESGHSTPRTDSSCEFVRINSDGCEFAKSKSGSSPSNTDIPVTTQTARSLDENEHMIDDSVPPYHSCNPHSVTESLNQPRTYRHHADLESSDNDDERTAEIQRLMGLLQERSKSRTADLSDTSNSDTDSDYVRVESLSVGEQEIEEPEVNLIEPAQPLVLGQAVNPADHDDERLPDPDDRVESDMLPQTSERTVSEPENNMLIRHYRFSPNSHLNSTLTLLAMTAIGFAFGLAIGNYLGTTREANLQNQIQEGQRFRLRAVQDDLLMCLRKQEDIDQTIGKLNEIEAILVDAEHWRNEYEELLKLKLTNEETLRAERDELNRKLQTCRSQTGHNANTETLQRQETTLNSVYEKLEDSLRKKDDQITDLQERLSDFVANLTHCSHMRDLYLTSLEDKSRLALDLREQIFSLERKVFDYQTEETNTESRCSGVITPETESVDQSVENHLGDPVDVNTSENSVNSEAVNQKPGVRDSVVEDETSENMMVENTCGSKDHEIYYLQSENEQLRQEMSHLRLDVSQLSSALNATQNATCNQELLRTLKLSASKSLNNILNATQTLYTQILTNYPSLNVSFNTSMLNSELLQLQRLQEFQVMQTLNQTWEKLNNKMQQYRVMETLNQTWESVVNKTKTVTSDENVESVKSAIGNGFSSLMAEVKNGVDIVKMKIKENSPTRWGYGSESEDFVQPDFSEEVETHFDRIDATTEVMDTPSKGSDTDINELDASLERVVRNTDEVNQVEENNDFPLSDSSNFTMVDYELFNPVANHKHHTQTSYTSTTRRGEPKQSGEEKHYKGHRGGKGIGGERRKRRSRDHNYDEDNGDDEIIRKKEKSNRKDSKLVKKMRKLRNQVEKFSQWKQTSTKRYEKSSDMLDMIEDIEESFSHSLKRLGDDSLKYLSCQSRYWKQHLYSKREPGGRLDESCQDVLHPWQLSHAVETGWIFDRAAEREYRRETPDDWFWSKLDDSDIKLTRGQIPHSKLRV